MKRAKKGHHFACALSTIAAAIHNNMSNKLTTTLITQAAIASSSGSAMHKSCGRYRCGGTVPLPKELVRDRLEDDVKCDEMEFFMFIDMSRESFSLLVSICEATINRTPLNRECDAPNEKARKKRLFGPRV